MEKGVWRLVTAVKKEEIVKIPIIESDDLEVDACGRKCTSWRIRRRSTRSIRGRPVALVLKSTLVAEVIKSSTLGKS